MMKDDMKRYKGSRQRGAVSIFVVVFSAMFVTIITVSFVSLMIRAQQQASNADLSNSAYDAALAGVEDGKRLLLKYRQCLRDSGAHSDCNTVLNLFANPDCNMVRKGITGAIDDDETLIESATGSDVTSKKLDQAYTCVKIGYTTESKEILIRDGESLLMPIESSGKTYDRISLSWFVQDPADVKTLDLPSGVIPELPRRDQWSDARPPILRAQWIQHGATFSSSDFDYDETVPSESEPRANTKTTFLYPNVNGTSSTSFNLIDSRSDAPGVSIKSPTLVRCGGDYASGQYACNITLTLPVPINDSGSRVGYLQLGALYNNTKVRISLLNGNDPVQIVAPSIDSTGRANDLFRRIRVGVSFTGEYPRANFDVNGNLCKDFAVTNDSYIPGNNCNP